MSFGEHCARCLASWSFPHRAAVVRVGLCRAVLVLMTGNASLLVGFELPASADQRPNILFFFTDDQPHDARGAAGHPILQTQLLLGYHLGISPDTLAKWYAGQRSTPARK